MYRTGWSGGCARAGTCDSASTHVTRQGQEQTRGMITGTWSPQLLPPNVPHLLELPPHPPLSLIPRIASIMIRRLQPIHVSIHATSFRPASTTFALALSTRLSSATRLHGRRLMSKPNYRHLSQPNGPMAGTRRLKPSPIKGISGKKTVSVGETRQWTKWACCSLCCLNP